MTIATIDVPTALERRVLFEKGLAGLTINKLNLTALHAIQTEAVERKFGHANSDVDRILEIMSACAGLTLLNLWCELKFR